MADFALWDTACERAIRVAVIGDVVTAAIRTMMTERTEPWVGTSSELLTLLTSAGGNLSLKLRKRFENGSKGPLPCCGRSPIRVVFGGKGRARRSVTLLPRGRETVTTDTTATSQQNQWARRAARRDSRNGPSGSTEWSALRQSSFRRGGSKRHRD
jgi:hypothetical protein